MRLKSRSKVGPSVPPARTLLKQALVAYAQNWFLLLSITIIVALPYGIIGLTSGDSSTNVLAAYGSFAALIMNLALIWSVTQLSQNRPVRSKEAYYQGTAATVRFILVSLVLLLQLVPFSLGALLFSRATVGSTTAVSLPEFMLIGLVWGLLALPSLYWLNRHCFAIFAVTESGVTPFKALRTSKAAVKGRSLTVFGRLSSIAIILLLSTLLPTIALLLLLPSSLSVYGLAALQLIVSVTFLPILYLYLHKLYLSLT